MIIRAIIRLIVARAIVALFGVGGRRKLSDSTLKYTDTDLIFNYNLKLEFRGDFSYSFDLKGANKLVTYIISNSKSGYWMKHIDFSKRLSFRINCMKQ